jgi:1-acyl-sn-glycerol-3-phosphate acyltransferase
MFRTALTTIALLLGTFLFGSLALLAQLFGVQPRPGSAYEYATRGWARWLLGAAGVKVVRRGHDARVEQAPRVYIANHVSWFDIPASIEALPPYGFLAKRELEKVPLFGPAARAVGVIYLDRENRKAAFSAIEDAASKIRAGASVLVYPEGTRGERYALRPFKKGAFVLAIGSGVPIVPVVIHGTIAVNPRGEFRASPGTVYVHTLEPVPTAGLTYDDRDQLAETVRLRMAECLREVYGVDPALEARHTKAAPAATPELSLE